MPVADLSAETVHRGLGTAVIGRHGRFYPCANSTQDLARAAGRVGAPEGMVITADWQSAGRGRLGRPWQAPAGGSLLLSILLRPTPAAYPMLSVVAGLAACEAIEELTELPARMKWPNDVLVHERKVAGILVEGESAGEAADFAVVGIGINVNLDPSILQGIPYPATSLRAELGHEVSRGEVAQALLRHLDRLYIGACAGRSPLQAWRERLVTLGRQVQVNTGREVEQGSAEGVDETGALLLRRRDGTLVTLLAGEVTLQG